MKTGERLLVFLSGEHVADVSRARTGAVSLEYTSTGRAAGATPLSLALPVSPARYTDRRVTHFLDGLLPEHPGTRAAMARHFQIGTTDAFSLLHGAGLDCAGAVQFCTEDAADAIRRGGSLEPESDSDIEVRLAEMEMDDAVSWVKRHEHWSLAGMQPKLALREEDGRWFTATGSEATPTSSSPASAASPRKPLTSTSRSPRPPGSASTAPSHGGLSSSPRAPSCQPATTARATTGQ